MDIKKYTLSLAAAVLTFFITVQAVHKDTIPSILLQPGQKSKPFAAFVQTGHKLHRKNNQQPELLIKFPKTEVDYKKYAKVHCVLKQKLEGQKEYSCTVALHKKAPVGTFYINQKCFPVDKKISSYIKQILRVQVVKDKKETSKLKKK